MASNSISIQPSEYIKQLAKIYQKYKTTDLKPEDKVCLYINERECKLEVFAKKEGAKKEGLAQLNDSHFKIIFQETDELTHDRKIQLAAAKALLFLPWNQKFTTKLISQYVTFNEEDISHFTVEKIRQLKAMLEVIYCLSRSSNGGNGAFFVSCPPSHLREVFPSGRMVIKFMGQGEAKRVILADRFFHEMGYTVPSTKYFNGDTPVGTMISQHVRDSLELSAQPNCIRESTEKKSYILVMSLLKAIDLTNIEKPMLAELLSNETFLTKMGELIFLDMFIGNVDRWSGDRCNPGNIMVSQSDFSIHLMDHEFWLSPEKQEEIYLKLVSLIKGESTDSIILNLQHALNHFRKDGSDQFVPKMRKKMKLYLNKGILKGRKKLTKALSEPVTLRRLFCIPSYAEQSLCACKLIERLKR
ncbi:MAG: hypothetical protein ACHQUC_01520 [Chlamydiales bacterium]